MKIRFVAIVALGTALLPFMSDELAAQRGKNDLKPLPGGYQPSDQPSPRARPTKKPRKQTPENPPEEELFDPSEPLDESDSEPSAKNGVPDDDAQQASTKDIKEIYGDEYKNAKTPAQKKALARRLLQKAIETEKDLPGRYVLLRLSRDIATQAADGTTAFLAIAEMAKTFAIERPGHESGCPQETPGCDSYRETA